MMKQTGMTLQEVSNIPTNNYFKNIKNYQDMIAIGGISDEDDRYTNVISPDKTLPEMPLTIIVLIIMLISIIIVTKKS